MAVMKVQTVEESAQSYDQQAAGLTEALRSAPGFLAHFGHVQGAVSGSWSCGGPARITTRGTTR
jgi:hypothetical protein